MPHASELRALLVPRTPRTTHFVLQLLGPLLARSVLLESLESGNYEARFLLGTRSLLIVLDPTADHERTSYELYARWQSVLFPLWSELPLENLSFGVVTLGSMPITGWTNRLSSLLRYCGAQERVLQAHDDAPLALRAQRRIVDFCAELATADDGHPGARTSLAAGRAAPLAVRTKILRQGPATSSPRTRCAVDGEPLTPLPSRRARNVG
jgi:hypothetical protein